MYPLWLPHLSCIGLGRQGINLTQKTHQQDATLTTMAETSEGKLCDQVHNCTHLYYVSLLLHSNKYTRNVRVTVTRSATFEESAWNAAASSFSSSSSCLPPSGAMHYHAYCIGQVYLQPVVDKNAGSNSMYIFSLKGTSVVLTQNAHCHSTATSVNSFYSQRKT